ncbi:fimbrial protein [Pseudomonas sp. IB20]|uniref:fimbria/pilus outer membrane usher protein n=1 Tax=Pseudomonas TaxID=286 RepID=UPI000B9FEC77|nr:MULTISPECIES: fimbria/pilus outer membrane usher protein [unclassified Pseudomonas]MCV2228672.1 fimbrial biogenesis outer membrane usher protein [Pseudomonas sp. AU10]OZO01101.1 fimbrial protein [Pseudomonas sp. IB20]
MSPFKVKTLDVVIAVGSVLSASTFALDAAAAVGPSSAPNDGGAVIFNDVFMSGAQKIDVSRYVRGTPLDPGTHLVDIFLNNNQASSANVLFVRVKGQAMSQACFSKTILVSLGLDIGRLEKAQLERFDQGDRCVIINELWEQASSDYDSAQLRLNLQVPQIALSKQRRGMVDPSVWDQGAPVAFANYNYNTYMSHQNAAAGGDNRMVRNDYLNVSGGVNLGPAQLRSEMSYSGDTVNGYQWQNTRTFLQTSLPAVQSRLVVGQSFTSGQFFDSIGFTGAEIATDERMIPDGQRGYAPVIRGVARTQAKVTIKQGSYLLLETSVSPGPFELNDLYPTGYGGDLQVTVTEADGSVQSFAVPFASVPSMLREGAWRYSATVGQLRDLSLSVEPVFTQLTYNRGVNNFVTAYTAMQLADNYLAGLGGIGLNTSFGAVTADVTMSDATLNHQQSQQGMSFKLSHSYRFPTSDTSISLAAYRYSTSGFLTLHDTAYLNSQFDANRVTPSDLRSQKSRFDLTMSQPLDRYGQLYLVGSTTDQWGVSGRTTLFQLGYSNTYKRIGYSLNASRMLSGPNLTTQRNSISLGITVPFGDQSEHTQTFTTNLSSLDGKYNAQTMIYGTALDDNSVAYGVNAGYNESGGQTDFGVNAQRQFSNMDVRFAASQSGDYRQYSSGIAGSVVAHEGGVTLGRTLGEAFAIVEAPGAQGAKVANANNTYINASGYAVVPYLSPFRMNEVMLSPEGLDPNIELKQTSQSIAPYAGAGVHLKFATQYGRGVLFDLKQSLGEPIPVGADVYGENNEVIGVFGQGSRAFVRSASDAGTWTVKWGNQSMQQCTYLYALPRQDKSDVMTHVSGTCVAAKVEER